MWHLPSGLCPSESWNQAWRDFVLSDTPVKHSTVRPASFRHPTCLLVAALLGLIVPFAGACSHPNEDASDPRVAWLAERAVQFRGIDPALEPLDDLDGLGRALDGVDIVMLGEQTHGDGATFLAKTRIIQCLHQRLGFDVLAIESGLFACEVAGDRILAGRPAREMVDASVFDVWGRSAHFQPLVAHLDATRRTGRPLELTGFDMQLTGSLSRDELLPVLKGAIGAGGVDAPAFLDALGALTVSMERFRKIPGERRQAFAREAEAVDRALERRADDDGRFLRQVARSTAVNVRFLWEADFDRPVPEVMNRRDAQMAENLLWLAEHRYPGRRIIVWAATSHISRNRQRIQKPLADPGMIPMGHHVWQRMGPRAYALAFTSARGQVATWRSTPWDLAPPRRGSLEHAFAALPGDTWFLDLRTHVRPGDWLAAPVLARPMGYSRMTAVWPDIVDGFVFVRNAEPSLERKE